MTAKFRASSLILLSVLLSFSAWVHLTNLDWGVPSMTKTLNVMGSAEELERLVPVMLEQRRKYYEMMADLFDTAKDLRRAHDELTHRWDLPYFEPIPRDGVLDRVRNYLIGSSVSDEQITLVAIGGLDPRKLDFTPAQPAYYGVLYYYTAAAFLAAGKVLGWVSLSPGVEYYFTHPDETRRVFMLIRSVGGVCVVLSVAVLALIMGRRYGERLGLLSAAFLASFPLLVSMSHMTKGHLFGMFFIALSLGIVLKILKSERPSEGMARPFMALGVCLGMSAGGIFTNAALGTLIFFTEWAARDWNLVRVLKSRRFWISSAVFLLVSAAANFYLLLNLSEFRRYIQSNVFYFPAFVEMQLAVWPSYLKEFFTEQISVFFGPLAAAGVWYAFRGREKFMQACALALAVLFVQNLLTTRHAPVNVRLFPFLAVLAAWGWTSLWQKSRGRLGKSLLAGYLVLALATAALQCAYYRGLHRSPSRLDLAGEWINRNVPKGSSIAAWGNSFAPLEFPPIRFLDYKMVTVPQVHLIDSWPSPVSLKKMPRYLVLYDGYAHGQAHYPESRLVSGNYRDVREWKGGCPWFERWFGTVWVRAGNWRVKVMEKKPNI